MLAISLTQPWAWAIYNGKDIENRNWRSSVRGTVAIQAARAMSKEQYQEASRFIEWASRNQAKKIFTPAPNDLVRGAIIGLVDIVGIVAAHPSPWFMGRYGYVCKNPRSLTEPIYCQGAQGFWPIPSDVLEKIYQQLAVENSSTEISEQPIKKGFFD
jgi:hypothetical protein